MDYLKACIGISPLYNPDFGELRSLVKAEKQTLEASQPTCVVFTLDDGRGSLFKLLQILSTFVKLGFIRTLLINNCRFITKAYGIYPTASKPVVIFEMQSPAEGYVVENILPRGPDGLNGYLRLIVTRLTKINPVLGGIALVIREKT